jgi:calcium channel MID1
VHALPFCPTTVYSVPLPAPLSNALAYDASNIPDNLTTPLLAYLTNFTTSLLTVACGRDIYFPLQTCADCQVAYRKWLCTVSLPRCGEFSSSPQQQQQQQPQQQQEGQPQQQQRQRRQQGTLAVPPLPPAALPPQASGTPWRNPALGNATANYAVLLPCIETCYATNCACPVFLGFKCPRGETTGGPSYGVGFIDSTDGDVPGGGLPGGAQDQWGNVFYNGS